MKTWIKQRILGRGRNPHRIPLGLYRGLTLSIDTGSESLFYFGVYEAETNSVLRRYARQAKSVLDIGAACGELTVWVMRQPGIERVLAYDAAPNRWPVFRENIRLNNLEDDERLTAVEGWFLPENEAPDQAELLLQNLPEPIFMKIDVDGGESGILERLRPVLRGKTCLLLVETHSAELDKDCFHQLQEAGYRCERIAQAWWRKFVPEQRPAEFNQWIAAEPLSSR